VSDLRQLRRVLSDWLVFYTERLTLAEKSALYLTGGVSIVGFLLNRSENFFGDLVAVVMTTTIIFLILSMRGYDDARSFSGFERVQLFFRGYDTLGRVPYIPISAIETSRVPTPSITRKVRCKWEDERLRVSDELVLLLPEHPSLKVVPKVLLGLLVVSILGALAQGRGALW
jgi:glycine betaine/proline transport system substrate-binding protein